MRTVARKGSVVTWKVTPKRRTGSTARFTEYWSTDGRYLVSKSKSWFSGLPVVYRAIVVTKHGQCLISTHRRRSPAFRACERHAHQVATAVTN